MSTLIGTRHQAPTLQSRVVLFMRERLALLHDVEGQFRHSLRDGVFQVRLELPA